MNEDAYNRKLRYLAEEIGRNFHNLDYEDARWYGLVRELARHVGYHDFLHGFHAYDSALQEASEIGIPAWEPDLLGHPWQTYELPEVTLPPRKEIVGALSGTIPPPTIEFQGDS